MPRCRGSAVERGCTIANGIRLRTLTEAKLLYVSVGTLYNHIPDVRELRTSRIPAQLEGSTPEIPLPHRMKGGALVIGTRRGKVGPYGADTGNDAEGHNLVHAEPGDEGTDR
ncbi:hypothetical protein AB0B13_18850 [Streptomyces sp. NPDC042898]|uniref:hypothetical protein n=1 Tax=unclassified Streptomyces TaxID=2593676 RepID=UPI0033175265